MNDINLDGLRMNAVETAATGVISEETVFTFHQDGDRVWAEYAGGRVERGYLVGISENRGLEFRYCQLQTGGVLHGGLSKCEIVRGEDGLVRVVEHFEWESRGGRGVNVIREIPG
jgi:hypothetical protein